MKNRALFVLLVLVTIVALAACGGDDPADPAPTPKHALYFEAAGGAGTMAPLSIPEGETNNLPDCAFTREGHVFAGWAESADGAVAYTNQAYYIMGIADATLHAVWRSPRLTFDANGGDGMMDPMTIPAGTVTNLGENIFFNNNGTYFLGWATAADGEVAYTNRSSYTMGNSDVTLFAVWSTAVNFTALEANGESGVTTTTELTLTFDVDPVGLTIEDITVTGATKGTLNGTGTVIRHLKRPTFRHPK